MVEARNPVLVCCFMSPRKDTSSCVAGRHVEVSKISLRQSRIVIRLDRTLLVFWR